MVTSSQSSGRLHVTDMMWSDAARGSPNCGTGRERHQTWTWNLFVDIPVFVFVAGCLAGQISQRRCLFWGDSSGGNYRYGVPRNKCGMVVAGKSRLLGPLPGAVWGLVEESQISVSTPQHDENLPRKCIRLLAGHGSTHSSSGIGVGGGHQTELKTRGRDAPPTPAGWDADIERGGSVPAGGCPIVGDSSLLNK